MLNIELPYDQAIPLFSIYLKELYFQTNGRTHMCIAALFTIVSG